MASTLLFLTSALLLFVNPDKLALVYSEAYSFKFFVNMFTHMLAHGNYEHFLGNYSFMLPFLIFVEYKLKQLKTLVLFLACGFGGLALQVFIAGSTSTGVIGSSAAAFGVYTAASIILSENRRFALLALPMLVLQMLDQLAAATNPFNPGVAYWAHIGGGMMGIIIGIAYLLIHQIHRRKSRRQQQSPQLEESPQDRQPESEDPESRS